jgi:hypothetical protein
MSPSPIPSHNPRKAKLISSSGRCGPAARRLVQDCSHLVSDSASASAVDRLAVPFRNEESDS